jgi:signal transduction histidine kinase
MDENTQKRLFKIEERFTAPGTMNETGTGLGLLITQHFVTVNKGSMAIESKQGKGTTFTARLPK